MAKYIVYDSELTQIANSLRSITNSTSTLKWNGDFLSEIEAIKTSFNEEKQKSALYLSQYNTYKASSDSYQAQAAANYTSMQSYKNLYETLKDSVVVSKSQTYEYVGSTVYGDQAVEFFEATERAVKRQELGLQSYQNVTYTTDEYVIYVGTQICLGPQKSQIICVPMINGSVKRNIYRYYDPSTESQTNTTQNRFGTGGINNDVVTNTIHGHDTFFRVVLKANEN